MIRSRTLRTWGDSRSGLAEKLADRIDQLDSIGNPTLAFLASGIEGIKVRVTAKSEDEETAARILASEEQFLRNLLGDIVFGIDEETMETVVLNSLRRQGMTLAVAESLTGGVMSSRLSDIDRNMEVFKGAVISAGHAEAAVGEDRGLAAARHAKETYGTDVGVAVVLPDPSEGARRGTVYLGIVLGNQEYTEHVALPGDHNRLRNYAVISVMNFVISVMNSPVADKLVVDGCGNCHSSVRWNWRRRYLFPTLPALDRIGDRRLRMLLARIGLLVF